MTLCHPYRDLLMVLPLPFEKLAQTSSECFLAYSAFSRTLLLSFAAGPATAAAAQLLPLLPQLLPLLPLLLPLLPLSLPLPQPLLLLPAASTASAACECCGLRARLLA